MGQSKEIKLNWKGRKNFDICFCVKLIHYEQSFISGRETLILVIIFWNFTVFSDKSILPQVKRNLISSISNLVYELLHELPDGLRYRIVGNEEIFK